MLFRFRYFITSFVFSKFGKQHVCRRTPKRFLWQFYIDRLTHATCCYCLLWKPAWSKVLMTGCIFGKKIHFNNFLPKSDSEQVWAHSHVMRSFRRLKYLPYYFTIAIHELWNHLLDIKFHFFRGWGNPQIKDHIKLFIHFIS